MEIKKCKCGAEISYYKGLCDKCYRIKCNKQTEKYYFEKARKINIKDYKYDFIYDPNTEKYFEEIDILEEYYKIEDIDFPTYVYACFPIEFNLDMYEIVQNELKDNHFEDAYDFIDKDSLKELQKIVNEWTESQGIISWEKDCNTIILLE